MKVLEYFLSSTLNLPVASTSLSCEISLCEIVYEIADGLLFKRPHKRTLTDALDLTKTLNMVCHKILFHVYDPSKHLQKMLSNYITRRQSYIEFRSCRLTVGVKRVGEPQEGILSPLISTYLNCRLLLQNSKLF